MFRKERRGEDVAHVGGEWRGGPKRRKAVCAPALGRRGKPNKTPQTPTKHKTQPSTVDGVRAFKRNVRRSQEGGALEAVETFQKKGAEMAE